MIFDKSRVRRLAYAISSFLRFCALAFTNRYIRCPFPTAAPVHPMAKQALRGASYVLDAEYAGAAPGPPAYPGSAHSLALTATAAAHSPGPPLAAPGRCLGVALGGRAWGQWRP